MRRRGHWVIWLALTGVAGLLLLIAAHRLARPELIGPGLLLFASGAFAAGADAIIRRHTIERNRDTRVTVVFTGSAARLIGLALVILAGALAVAGVSFVLDREQQLYHLALARPGVVLIPFGSMAAAMGSANVLGARDWRGSAWRFLASVPERLGGAFLLLLGLVLLGVGVVEIAAPRVFDDAVEAIFAPFGGPPWTSAS